MRRRVRDGVAVDTEHCTLEWNAARRCGLPLNDLGHSSLPLALLTGLDPGLGPNRHGDATARAEVPVSLCKPPDFESIHAEARNDLLFVTLAEQFAFDHPGNRPPAKRTLDDFHSAPRFSEQIKKGAREAPFLARVVYVLTQPCPGLPPRS
jgi:hypothetical protein